MMGAQVTGKSEEEIATIACPVSTTTITMRAVFSADNTIFCRLEFSTAKVTLPWRRKHVI
jgi:hypothetical protein